MSLLAPLWLWVAGTVAAGTVLLHFLSRRRPRPAPLPTARFVPDVPARAPSLSSRPSDLLLLLLRVLTVLAIGLALARPSFAPRRRSVARLVVVDTSRAVRNAGEARDSATALLAPGDTMLSYDGSLTAALVRAVRTGAALKQRADSIELVIVSPLVADAFDAATKSVRAQWPGRSRLVRVAAASAAALPRIVVEGAPDDPIRAAVALMGRRTGPEVRIERGAMTAADSTFARSGVLVLWPESGTGSESHSAVTAGNVVVVAPFARIQPFLRSYVPTFLRIPARWADGSPAALERSFANGCIREVAIPLASQGDLVLRRSVRDLIDVLAAPCGGPRDLTAADSATVAWLARSGPLMPSRAAPDVRHEPSRAAAWLLGIAALLMLGELVLRPQDVRP